MLYYYIVFLTHNQVTIEMVYWLSMQTNGRTGWLTDDRTYGQQDRQTDGWTGRRRTGSEGNIPDGESGVEDVGEVHVGQPGLVALVEDQRPTRDHVSESNQSIDQHKCFTKYKISRVKVQYIYDSNKWFIEILSKRRSQDIIFCKSELISDIKYVCIKRLLRHYTSEQSRLLDGTEIGRRKRHNYSKKSTSICFNKSVLIIFVHFSFSYMYYINNPSSSPLP